MNKPQGLVIWTVYDHPADFPHAYVARAFVNEQPTDHILVSGDLELLRDQLQSMGLVMLMRHPDDDPKIMETWL